MAQLQARFTPRPSTGPGISDNNVMRILATLFIAMAPLLAADSLLLSPLEAQKEIASGKALLLHVGAKADYEAGHIAGARFVTLADISTSSPLRLQMPDDAALTEMLLKLGVENGRKVIVYAGNDSVQSATRVWFTLDYAGLEARLINGGLAAWKKAGLPIDTAPAPAARGNALKIRPRREMLADATYIQAHLTDKSVAILDARLEEFYSGKTNNQMPRQGHITGAQSVPFPSLLNANKEFLPTTELKAKIGDAKTVVTYCHIGMQATVAYFAARLAGKDDVKLYDGSFEEWSAKPELPVKIGDQP
jgi:thiosulfate/3-mercaptopyruvate sulfurtransferase